MKEIEKKKIQDAALKIWPECPLEYLEEAFYFNNEPTAEWLVEIGKFAEEVGTPWSNANAFQKLLERIEMIQKFTMEKFPGKTIENILFELHHDFMRAGQFASCFENPQSPHNTEFTIPKHFEKAHNRAAEAVEKMYGSGFCYIDDGRSIAMFLEKDR
jgi:hypothetical protein